MSTGDQKLDEFESLFRSALTDVFHYERPSIGRVALVTDVEPEPTRELAEALRRWLSTADGATELAVHPLPRRAWAEGERAAVPTLLDQLAELTTSHCRNGKVLLQINVSAKKPIRFSGDKLTHTGHGPVLI